MTSPLTGRIAVVTGGASGIGLATAHALRAASAEVVIADVDVASGRRAAQQTGATFVECDVTSTTSWSALVGSVEERLGGIDIGVLNAGVDTGATALEELSEDAYRRIMSINVDGVVFGVRALLPALRRRGGGDLVVTASLAGLVAFPMDPVYTATKHAVIGLVRSLGPTLGAGGVRINAVCPGLTTTPLLGGARAELERAGMPLLAAADVAAAVLGCVRDGGSGQAWVCQAGRAPVVYRFHGVPGPAGGVRPPAAFADPGA